MEFIHEIRSWGDDILAAQNKWEVHSISRPQEQSGLIVS